MLYNSLKDLRMQVTGIGFENKKTGPDYLGNILG